MDNQKILTEDGSHSLISARYEVPYHSTHGAVQETRHIFIEAALLQKIHSASSLKILDIGFGSGLNAFMTYLSGLSYSCKIYFHTVESHPISEAEAMSLNFASILKAEDHTPVFRQLHTCPWEQDHMLTDSFIFQKQGRQFESIDVKAAYDIIYFDAFAPEVQPELWEEPQLRKMYEALIPGGILTTYCAKGAVKRCLKKIGYTVEALPGPPGKREMTRATRPI